VSRLAQRLVIRGLDLLARIPGCGFIGWGLVFVAYTKESDASKAPPH
jgi:hypothetical protein